MLPAFLISVLHKAAVSIAGLALALGLLAPISSLVAAAQGASASLNAASLAATTLSPTLSGTAGGVRAVRIEITEQNGTNLWYGPTPVTNGSWTITLLPPLDPQSAKYLVSVYSENRTLLSKGKLSIPTPPAKSDVNFSDGLHFYLGVGQTAQEGTAGAFFLKLISASPTQADVEAYAHCSSGACSMSELTIPAGSTNAYSGHAITFVSNNRGMSILFVTSTGPAVKPLGVFRVPVEFFGQPIIDLPSAPGLVVTGTTTATGVQQFLTVAEATHTKLIIGFGDPDARLADYVNSDGTFSVKQWEDHLAGLCGGQQPSPSACFDFSRYVADGTLVAFHLIENQGDYYEDSTGKPTTDQVKAMSAYMKSVWPYLPITIDTGHACDETASFTPNDLDYEIINISIGNTPSFLATAKQKFSSSSACATASGLGTVFDINPLAKTKSVGDALGSNSVSLFEQLMDFALLYPGTDGTTIWRWGDTSGDTIVQGKEKVLQNFWNNSLNKGITAAMKRISQCAAAPSSAACPSTAP